jgi:hypothetical protein
MLSSVEEETGGFFKIPLRINKQEQGSHPNHEDRQTIISTVLIRRGGFLPGRRGLSFF